MNAQGPLGRLPGMKWCGESNRYFSVLGSLSSYGASEGESAVSLPNRTQALEAVRSTPVHAQIVRSLPGHNRKRGRIASADCAICLRSGLDHRSDPRVRFVQLPCKHSFHLYCVEEWLVKRSGSCPVCRQSVDISMATAARSI